MPMVVSHARVNVPVGVGLAGRLRAVVGVLMVFIVRVPVLVPQFPVFMRVLVPFREVEPDAHGHQDTRRDERHGDGVPEDQHRDRASEEWRQREIRPGSSRADASQGDDEEDQADAVAPETHQARDGQRAWIGPR